MSRPRLADHDPAELIVVGLFFIGGAVLSVAFAIVYIGVNVLAFMGAQWSWIWE